MAYSRALISSSSSDIIAVPHAVHNFRRTLADGLHELVSFRRSFVPHSASFPALEHAKISGVFPNLSCIRAATGNSLNKMDIASSEAPQAAAKWSGVRPLLSIWQAKRLSTF
eukprot:CAMPEP_0194370818 /NCGR_PEP_ID=MMETSP0174-20130528/19172_1 /TAXON_ID=216777 /ORGANISM="Proboscia alata, Strain PI-D3" /LENGTH=111 /DNA_ID=CAMNT_0039148519 /DNA_START=80 /DNA_END=415 /DNA_ORIENTATION=-